MCYNSIHRLIAPYLPAVNPLPLVLPVVFLESAAPTGSSATSATIRETRQVDTCALPSPHSYRSSESSKPKLRRRATSSFFRITLRFLSRIPPLLAHRRRQEVQAATSSKVCLARNAPALSDLSSTLLVFSQTFRLSSSSAPRGQVKQFHLGGP